MAGFSLVLTSVLGSAIAVSSWYGVNAQTTNKKPTNPSNNQSAPQFTRSQDAKGFQLTGKGKAFQPKNLPLAKKPDEVAGKRGIIGWDDRTPMLSRKYPWSAIGRVQGFDTEGKGYHCTGTLISEDVVLTNAHCVINPETRQFSKEVFFAPNVINGQVADKADVAKVTNVIYGTDFSGSGLSNQQNDWAILKLDKAIGRKYGYLGWTNIPSSDLIRNRGKYIFVGYSGDFPDNNRRGYEGFTAGLGWTASAQVGCSIVDAKDSVLYHDCDTTGGSSGGAIIGIINGEPRIVALNNAELRDKKGQGVINLAVPLDFLEKLSR
ncbi:peptidase S1 and S6 chymotrypsin/Hap [Calothrix sp. 336/3]|nr:peptidase S1 and S6 chymotrypsin/Hap [Calothrix sp. 336/3]